MADGINSDDHLQSYTPVGARANEAEARVRLPELELELELLEMEQKMLLELQRLRERAEVKERLQARLRACALARAGKLAWAEEQARAERKRAPEFESEFQEYPFHADFPQFYYSCLPALQNDLNQDERRNLDIEFRLYQSREPGQWRAILKHPKEFHDFVRKFHGAFYEDEIFDAKFFFRMIDQFAQTKISGRRLSFNRSGLLRRDPRWHMFLFALSGAVSSSMIRNYESGSVLSEIVQSITIGFAVVGSCASLACLSMLYQLWSSRNGFEREVWTQRMENVATVATSIAFILSMLLLLPNKLSRGIVGAVLFVVVVLILIYAKCRPKMEAEAESAGNQLPTASASNPLPETATEVASNLLPQDSETEPGDSMV